MEKREEPERQHRASLCKGAAAREHHAPSGPPQTKSQPPRHQEAKSRQKPQPRKARAPVKVVGAKPSQPTTIECTTAATNKESKTPASNQGGNSVPAKTNKEGRKKTKGKREATTEASTIPTGVAHRGPQAERQTTSGQHNPMPPGPVGPGTRGTMNRRRDKKSKTRESRGDPREDQSRQGRATKENPARNNAA